jgi:hypothetical protein
MAATPKIYLFLFQTATLACHERLLGRVSEEWKHIKLTYEAESIAKRRQGSCMKRSENVYDKMLHATLRRRPKCMVGYTHISCAGPDLGES